MEQHIFKVLVWNIILFVTSVHNIRAQMYMKPEEKGKVVSGYVGIVNPVGSFSDGAFHSNFSHGYTVGMSMGLNIIKSNQMAYSFEVDPFIHFDSTGSRVNNLLLQPGIIFKERKGYSFSARVAFETAGRYGFSTAISKTIIRKEYYNFFLLLSLPSVRLGNNQPLSVGTAIALGIGF